MMEIGDSGLQLTASISNQQRNILSANPFDDSDESSNDSDVTWSPGDRVCPTAAHFNHCCQSKIDDWQNAASTRLEGTESLHYYITAFLDLLKDVPSFYACPPGAVQLTTEDSNCEQDHKFIDYLQCFGSPAPVFYRTKAETQPEVSIPTCARPLRSGFLTSIILAWSYIISCRWVEILQRAGEKSQILHDQGMQIEESFWDIARVENQKDALDPSRRDWKLAIPNSFFAFSTLLDFCASNGLEGEFLTGFACVLISTSRHAPPPKLAPPTMIPAVPMHSPPSAKGTMLFELFKSVENCISLSSTQDALDSLLCSAFFDPCVPCNLFGAASLGVRKALSTMEEIDNRQLLSAITNKKPQSSLLWAAAVCNGQATSFLNLSLHSLPPICLVAAFWTNTIQSFLQIAYSVRDSEESIIARANEFRTSYFCWPDLFVPWSPAPPFGTTPVHNLSLEVRAHLEHMHVPLSWKNHWLLDSGERIPAGSQHDLEVVKADGLCHSCPAGQSNDTPHPERYTADEQSGFATSRLFNWHRGYDDGIWLDDGKANIESVRQLQMHP
ncbi:uncharacterized protein BO95DRAFT_471552 [Aspergillus brunneoviolaceus CBS 621.78]|uniref:Uncharacterized protein n=1 Tax=Aspergillus brunneoviolaceus CBS 621.78 TaxID=1450534 RepID=A0ACD1GH79_9EURO|nr:hypothetical protein BO95DRAFT_471552 [Aspergillus brunneoviolaceus CBS 621.78]RAH48639.1 hypothetical protein BO95DRAFT_471552 [Aspergillus brunneoviolaceus CBS 621.78]